MKQGCAPALSWCLPPPFGCAEHHPPRTGPFCRPVTGLTVGIAPSALWAAGHRRGPAPSLASSLQCTFWGFSLNTLANDEFLTLPQAQHEYGEWAGAGQLLASQPILCRRTLWSPLKYRCSKYTSNSRRRGYRPADDQLTHTPRLMCASIPSATLPPMHPALSRPATSRRWST